MTLTPQKAPINKAKAASEESEHQTSKATQQIQPEAEETPKNNAGAKKSAQKQHDAQPEVASKPQGLDETNIPAQASGREEVPVRRISNEYALSISAQALAQILTHRRPSKHLTNVQDAGYARIFKAERRLCGHIVVIGNPGPVDLSDWHAPFDVDGKRYVLEPRKPSKGSNVRVYELMPSYGPAPGGGLPPQLVRKHRDEPPAYIGPRRRSPRDRKGVDSSRGAAAKPVTPAKKGKKKNEVKRIFTELYNSNSELMELKLLSQTLACGVVQLWRQRKPRLLRSLVEMRRLVRSCGIALHDLREFSGAVASVARRSLTSLVFPISVSESATRKQRELVSETFGPTGRLVACDACNIGSTRIPLNSWSWDTPPRPRADEACGALWPIGLFGPREEEVFT